MLSFFKKKKSADISPAVFPVTTDIHSHILPGIDDGSPDINTSLQLIKGLYALGIRKAIATPHIIGDLYRNTPDTIGAALEKTQAACEQAGIDMKLAAAAEYMLDDHFMQLLQQKAPLLCLHKNLVLTELSYSMPPHNLQEMAFNIITGGYQPVMAHPERYFYFHKDPEEYHRLKELGFHLQVNLLSLTGYYGRTVAKAAKYILDKDLASLVGTDLHHGRHLAALSNADSRVVFNKYLSVKKYNDLDELI